MAFEINAGILPVAGDSLLGESLLSDEALGRAGDALNETPVRAGVIKLAVSDGGLQEVEAKALRAALVAGRETGAAVISHCPSGGGLRAAAGRPGGGRGATRRASSRCTPTPSRTSSYTCGPSAGGPGWSTTPSAGAPTPCSSTSCGASWTPASPTAC